MLEAAARRLKALIFTRALVVTLLLGSFYIFKIGYSNLLYPAFFSYFIAVLYFLTIIYVILLRWIKTVSLFNIFAYAQILIDIIFEIALIYLTGGIKSWFSFTLLLSIISSSIVLNRRASYYVASFSSIFYGILLEVQFYYQLPVSTGNIFSSKDYLYNIFVHITAFYLVAFLSGYLAERLYSATQALQEKDSYIGDLKALSRDIVESMPSGVFTTDLDGKIITFNSSAQKITDKNIADVIGETIQDIFPFLKNIDPDNSEDR
ncbi:MAG: PAS domain-containing protein, partial [Nitrospirota bacterium]